MFNYHKIVVYMIYNIFAGTDAVDTVPQISRSCNTAKCPYNQHLIQSKQINEKNESKHKVNNNQTQRHIDSVNRKFVNGKIKKNGYLQCFGTYNLICTIHLCTPSSRLAAVVLCTHCRPVVLCHTKHILLFDISCPDHRKEHYTVGIFCFYFKIFFYR